MFVLSLSLSFSFSLATLLFALLLLSLFSGSRAALKHPLFRPILSHSIRICLSYRRPSATIPIRSVFSANTIATDRVRLNSVFFPGGEEATLDASWIKESELGGGRRLNMREGGRGVMRSIWTGIVFRTPRDILPFDCSRSSNIFFSYRINIVEQCNESSPFVCPPQDWLIQSQIPSSGL